MCKPCLSIKNRDAHLKNSYNLTELEYITAFDHQGGACAICGNKPRARRFHVDHDHKTGLVRGILCLWCNHKVLGGARENPEILKAAIAYLEDPPAVQALGEVYGKPARKR